MIEVSSLEYAFSKLDFKKQKQKDIKNKKDKLYKIWFYNITGNIETIIRSQYELERTRDIHKNIIAMITI